MGFHSLSTDVDCMIYYPRPTFPPDQLLYSANIYHFEGCSNATSFPLSPLPGALQASAFPLICPLTPEVQGQAEP